MSEVTDSTLAAETEDVDLLGPVDWIVVEFPGSRFDGTIFPILLDLEAQGTIACSTSSCSEGRGGTLEAFELSDLEDSEIGGLRDAERQLATLLSEEDVLNVANAIEPGSAAALVVWENLGGAVRPPCGRRGSARRERTHPRAGAARRVRGRDCRRGRGRSLRWGLHAGAWSVPGDRAGTPSYARRARWRRSPSSPIRSTCRQDRRQDRRR